MVEAKFRIVEAIYPGMTQLDFTAPHTVFSRIPGAETIVASEPGDHVVAGWFGSRPCTADARLQAPRTPPAFDPCLPSPIDPAPTPSGAAAR